jgi:hypothetical protein
MFDHEHRTIVSLDLRGMCNVAAVAKLNHCINTLSQQNIKPTMISIQETNLDRNPLAGKLHTNIGTYEAHCSHKRNIITAPNAKGGILTFIHNSQKVYRLQKNEAYLITLTRKSTTTTHIHVTTYISPSLNDDELRALYSSLTADLTTAYTHNRKHTILLTFAGDLNVQQTCIASDYCLLLSHRCSWMLQHCSYLAYLSYINLQALPSAISRSLYSFALVHAALRSQLSP